MEEENNTNFKYKHNWNINLRRIPRPVDAKWLQKRVDKFVKQFQIKVNNAIPKGELGSILRIVYSLQQSGVPITTREVAKVIYSNPTTNDRYRMFARLNYLKTRGFIKVSGTYTIRTGFKNSATIKGYYYEFITWYSSYKLSIIQKWMEKELCLLNNNSISLHQALTEAVRTTTNTRNTKIIKMFGSGKSKKEIAGYFGISRERVRQIISKIIIKNGLLENLEKEKEIQ